MERSISIQSGFRHGVRSEPSKFPTAASRWWPGHPPTSRWPGPVRADSGLDRKLSFPSDFCAPSDVARRLVLRPKTNWIGSSLVVEPSPSDCQEFIQMEGARDVFERRGPVFLEPVRRHLDATGFRFAKEGHAAAARVSDSTDSCPMWGPRHTSMPGRCNV